jgi:hypothetical protein
MKYVSVVRYETRTNEPHELGMRNLAWIQIININTYMFNIVYK